MQLSKYSLWALVGLFAAMGAVIVACGDDAEAVIPSGDDADAGGDDDTSTGDDDTSTGDDDDDAPPTPPQDSGKPPTIDAGPDGAAPKAYGSTCVVAQDIADGGNPGCNPGLHCHKFGEADVGERCTYECDTTAPDAGGTCPPVAGGSPGKCNNKYRCAVK